MFTRMNKVVVHTLFIALALGGGILIGYLSPPGDWYQTLAKPAFTPPNWMFPVVWSTIYVLIGIAGARTFLARPRSLAMGLWVAQLLVNFAWSPLFFGLHQMTLALIAIIALFALIIGFVLASLRHDRISALLFLPYVVWVLFALVLNATIVGLN